MSEQGKPDEQPTPVQGVVVPKVFSCRRCTMMLDGDSVNPLSLQTGLCWMCLNELGDDEQKKRGRQR